MIRLERLLRTRKHASNLTEMGVLEKGVTVKTILDHSTKKFKVEKCNGNDNLLNFSSLLNIYIQHSDMLDGAGMSFTYQLHNEAQTYYLSVRGPRHQRAV
jgi:hypothetical protein